MATAKTGPNFEVSYTLLDEDGTPLGGKRKRVIGRTQYCKTPENAAHLINHYARYHGISAKIHGSKETDAEPTRLAPLGLDNKPRKAAEKAEAAPKADKAPKVEKAAKKAASTKEAKPKGGRKAASKTVSATS